MFSLKFKTESQNFHLFSEIDTILLFFASYHSHSSQIVAGVTTLTTSLFTIHFKFGSETCSAIATLYQASINWGKYFSFAWYGIPARGVDFAAFLFLEVMATHKTLFAIIASSLNIS